MKAIKISQRLQDMGDKEDAHILKKFFKTGPEQVQSNTIDNNYPLI